MQIKNKRIKKDKFKKLLKKKKKKKTLSQNDKIILLDF